MSAQKMGISFALVVGLSLAGCIMVSDQRSPRFPGDHCEDGLCRAEVTGAVKDGQSGEPIRVAEVVVGSCQGYTDNHGVFQLFDCEPGCFDAIVSAYDYVPVSVEVEIHAGYNTISPIGLEPAQ